jgi:hypothetical protein
MMTRPDYNGSRVAGHVIAVDCDPDMGPVMLVTPIAIEPPEMRLAVIGGDAPTGRGTRLATTKECLDLAFFAVDQALVRDPGVIGRDVCEVDDLVSLLWPAVQRVIVALGRSDRPNQLTRYLDRETRHRVAEELIGVREAARQRAAGEVQHLIRSLVAIAADRDVTTRATALAALAPTIRRVLPET